MDYQTSQPDVSCAKPPNGFLSTTDSLTALACDARSMAYELRAKLLGAEPAGNKTEPPHPVRNLHSMLTDVRDITSETCRILRDILNALDG